MPMTPFSFVLIGWLVTDVRCQLIMQIHSPGHEEYDDEWFLDFLVRICGESLPSLSLYFIASAVLMLDANTRNVYVDS